MSRQTPTPPIELSEQSDAWLIAECLKSAEAGRAYRELLNRYAGLVFNVVYRMTQQYELSEEVTQDVFVKAYQNLSKFDQQRPFKPWLLRIASNTAISALRKKSRIAAQHVVSLNALEEQGVQMSEERMKLMDGTTLASESPLAALERQLSNNEVLSLLTRLDDKYKQVLILRYLKELSYEEVAEAMEIPLNTVRTWIKRGLEQLRRQMVTSGA